MSSFEWQNYPLDCKEVSYIKDMLQKFPDLNLKSLDLAELEDVAILDAPKQINSVALGQSHRLSIFGGLDSIENIARKTGAINKKTGYSDKLNDFYDLEDTWIDDGEPEEIKKSTKLAIPSVYYEDFFVNEGDLDIFKKSDSYIERKKMIESFDDQLQKDAEINKPIRVKKEKNKKKTQKNLKIEQSPMLPIIQNNNNMISEMHLENIPSELITSLLNLYAASTSPNPLLGILATNHNNFQIGANENLQSSVFPQINEQNINFETLFKMAGNDNLIQQFKRKGSEIGSEIENPKKKIKTETKKPEIIEISENDSFSK